MPMMNRRQFVKTAAVGTTALAAGNTAWAEEPMVVKLSTVAPEGTPWAEQVKDFKKRISAEGGGRFTVKSYLGGGLGDETVTSSECKRGAIQVWAGSTGALAAVVPELALFELPFLFNNVAEADHVIDNVLNTDMQKLLASRGFQILFWAENGYRSFGTTFGPVKTPEALKGRKMRSQENEVHLEMYRALGASPVPISVTEVLSSLQTKVVDGFDNTPLFTFAASWYQGVKHYSLTEAIYQPGIVVANKAWFDKLAPADQKMIMGDPKADAIKGRKGVRELAPLLIENFKAAKIEVHTLTPAEREVFAKACLPTHDKWIKGKGKSAAVYVAKAKAALAELRKKG
ncbi:MAG: TRAP transporter substrate-binding protein DctP [Myxococcaceae bacterium]|nr:TRAP transporter substrate-binding protein DctP [Myxococcaceae bacterium]